MQFIRVQLEDKAVLDLNTSILHVYSPKIKYQVLQHIFSIIPSNKICSHTRIFHVFIKRISKHSNHYTPEDSKYNQAFITFLYTFPKDTFSENTSPEYPEKKNSNSLYHILLHDNFPGTSMSSHFQLPFLLPITDWHSLLGKIVINVHYYLCVIYHSCLSMSDYKFPKSSFNSTDSMWWTWQKNIVAH